MLVQNTVNDLLAVITTTANALRVYAAAVETTTTTCITIRQRTSIAAIVASPGTTFLAAPAASTERVLKYASIVATGGANVITPVWTDGTPIEMTGPIPLAQGERAEYVDTVGWRVFDVNGALKQTQPQGMLLRAPQIITATNAAFPHPAGTRTIVVEGVGGGGASGGANNVAGSSGSGGNSGNWGRRTFTSVSGTSNVVVGAGGTAGAAGAAGNNGSNSTFTHNGVTVTVPGGIGGTVLGGAAAIGEAALNAGNAGSTNTDITIVGQLGRPARRPSASAQACIAGCGGSNPLGFGGTGIMNTTAASVAGAPGTGFGSGAAGRANGTSAANTAGTPGQIGVWIVWEFG